MRVCHYLLMLSHPILRHRQISNRAFTMTTKIPRLTNTAFIVLVCVSGLSSPAAAQGEASSQRIRATIAMAADFPYTREAFVIRRQAGNNPTDVILVREDITAAQLSDAIRALITVRHVGGDVPTASATMSLRRTQARNAERKTLPWVGRVLADLRRAAPAEVRGVGRARSVEIWLPRIRTENVPGEPLRDAIQ